MHTPAQLLCVIGSASCACQTLQMRRGASQTLGSSSMVKLKRMFLDGRTPEQIQEAEARAQQQAGLRMRRQDAVLHHDFDKMRREVECLGEPLPELSILCLHVWVLMYLWPTWQLANHRSQRDCNGDALDPLLHRLL